MMHVYKSTTINLWVIIIIIIYMTDVYDNTTQLARLRFRCVRLHENWLFFVSTDENFQFIFSCLLV